MNKDFVLKQMTIDEKIKWTTGNNMWFMGGNERLGIKEILVADGPHGVRVYKKRPGHAALELENMQESTLFPSAPAMASTFNEELIYKVGKTIGQECNNFYVDLLLAPGVNLKRSPLGGRNFEYYSEDPYLTGRMAISFINGVQSTKVGTCIKHFAFNEQENQRRFLDTIVDERTMHEFYLKPFKMAIDEAKPWAVMSSYNQVNHHYSSESKELLKDILRDRWNFDGVVISDWGGIQNKVKSIQNGCTIEMPGPGEFQDEIYDALKNYQLSETEIEESIKPLFGLYEKIEKNNLHGEITNLKSNHTIANEVAEEAIVLLKNDGILPLVTKPRVLVVGDFAKNPRINGGGSATLKPFILENPLMEIQENFETTFAQGYIEENTTPDLLREIKGMANQVDLILFFTGTTKNLECEGKDREHMNLPQGHIDVFDILSQLQKPIITILNNGSAVDVTPIEAKSNAIIESWFLGGANAKALVKIIKGEVNPSGRLSETFPLCIEHTPHYPLFPSKEDTVNYANDIINNGYRYYTTHKYPVRYPFGYGLSYTNFEYANLSIDKKTMDESEVLKINVDVKNTGSMTGKEVVQVYINDKESYLVRPVRELVAFQKIELEPNQSKTVEFLLDKNAFQVYNPLTHQFEVEAGEFVIEIAKNANEIVLKESVFIHTKNDFISHLTLEHPLKTFFIHKKEKTENLLNKYKKFEWYEIEEPALRVLKRVKRDFNISDIDFTRLLDELLK